MASTLPKAARVVRPPQAEPRRRLDLMPMVLHIETSDPALGENAPRRIEVVSRLTVGRGSENDLVLPDPQRHLSKTHCVIAFDGHGGTVTDTSTNGVFLDNSAERLQRDLSVPLSEGSVLRFGGYQISVVAISPSYAVSLPEAAHPMAEHSLSGPSLPDDGLFGDPLMEAPLGQGPSAGGLPSSGDLQDFVAQPETGAFAPVIPDDIDLLTGNQPPQQQWHGASQPDHTPADQVFFAPPRVTSVGIPDDFAPPPRAGGAVPGGFAPSQTPGGIIPDDWDIEDAPRRSSPRPAAPPPPERAFPEAAVAPRQVATAAPVIGRPAAGDNSAVAGFLAAVGLKGVLLSESEKIRLLQLAGETFATMVKGLSEILAARATTKQEFRIERTTIGAVRNNPLKFSESHDEALRVMLLGNAPGFLSAKESIDEAFADIQDHQLAVLGAMQLALATVVQRFDPDKLEGRLEQGSLIKGILPGARKARYWELYKTLYKEITTELEEDFQKAFGAEFARAYRKQIDRI